jgi:hypothetical protein
MGGVWGGTPPPVEGRGGWGVVKVVFRKPSPIVELSTPWGGEGGCFGGSTSPPLAPLARGWGTGVRVVFRNSFIVESCISRGCHEGVMGVPEYR